MIAEIGLAIGLFVVGWMIGRLQQDVADIQDRLGQLESRRSLIIKTYDKEV